MIPASSMQQLVTECWSMTQWNDWWYGKSNNSSTEWNMTIQNYNIKNDWWNQINITTEVMGNAKNNNSITTQVAGINRCDTTQVAEQTMIKVPGHLCRVYRGHKSPCDTSGQRGTNSQFWIITINKQQ